MVDFNSENVAGQSPKKLMYIIILQRSEYLAEAWEKYREMESKGADATKYLDIVKARLNTLYDRVRPSLVRNLKDKHPDSYKKIIVGLHSNDETELKDATDLIENYLDGINITRVDTNRRYDPTDLEAENDMYGL